MWHVETDYVAFVLILVMLVKHRRQEADDGRREKLFAMVLATSLASTVIDIVASLAMNQCWPWWGYQIAMSLYCMTMPCLAAAWLCYTMAVLFAAQSWAWIWRRLRFLLLPMALNLVLAATNPVTGLYFRLSPELVYSRGPLFLPFGIGLIFCYSLVCLAMVAANAAKMRPRSHAFLLASFFLVSDLAILIQLACPGWLIINASYAIVYLLCDMTLEEERRAALYRKIQEQNASLERAVQETEQMSRARADFFSRVSHDMRTPMNGILGLADLALTEADPAQVRQDLGKIRESGEYMLHLINDTLDLQRLDAGKVSFSPQLVDGRQMVDSVAAMVGSTAQKKGVAFAVENPENALCFYVRTDPVRVKQVLVNLLSNAVKFTPPGGRVTLALSQLSCSGKNHRIRFSVRDTGVGMSEAFMQKELYIPFAQETNAFSGQYAGSGLGLSITKNIVEKMGGSICAESALGKGTAFTVELEFEQADDAEAARERQEKAADQRTVQAGLAGRQILLCEDNALNAEIAVRLLQKAGCRVTVAVNGQEGVDRFSAAPVGAYFAVIMDIRMPVLNGLDAARALRALPRPDAAAVPIVAMTANAFAEDAQASAAAGMNAH